MNYHDFLSSKRLIAPRAGIDVERASIHPLLFDFQKDLVTWALRKGRAAIFADTGLGKTFMQLEWARLTGQRTLIIAPLSVARQTVREATKIDLQVHYTRSGTDLADGINITNYEMMDKFNAAAFGAVVLDESSILKGLDGKTRKKLTEAFSTTPLRLCCTATPAPNDISEIANHSEFLGIMPRADLLSTFFVHDEEWRLKRHAVTPFYRWLASWGMSVRKPSDLGYSDEGYDLPPLSVSPVWVPVDYAPGGKLFFDGLSGITERASVRHATAESRVNVAAELVNANAEQWIVWCGMNEESTALTAAIVGACEVTGSQSPEEKSRLIEAFQDGKYRVLVTKPKVAGFGMNFQNCHKMAFVGLSDSWEAYYQCVRRCYRFGQTKPVDAFIVLSEPERTIYENVSRKETEAKKMSDNLIANVQEFERAELGKAHEEWTYQEDVVEGDRYKLMLGDSAERMAEIESNTVALSVFSPPFISLYTYSATERDLGNCRDEAEFFTQFQFIIDELLRITMPGRNCCVHVAQVPAMLGRDGYIGLKDFRGKTIEAFIARGWIQHGEVCIDKDPQAQAIRTKSKALLFTQMRKDSSWSRPALADYILIFRKPGDNAVPVHPDISNNEWIEWARPIWYGIRESDTLQFTTARGAEDERHICPLQLGTIERCIRLWSNKGETVFSPFAGIGSEGYEALRLGRKFIGCELKPEYFKNAATNLRAAAGAKEQLDMFAVA